MKKIICICFFLCLFLLSGCEKGEEIEKIRDIDFTVCDPGGIPKEVLELVEGKKETPFKFTYSNQDYMYIAVGYGEQNRTNLDVVVEELYLSTNAVYVDTNLVSHEEGATQENIITYPYVVIKCEKFDVPVVFQ